MDNRKLKILAAVVDEYVRTGEPVGSKVIASLPQIQVSAATVRNDMAVLEQLGYLEQPHTSAGRVPTYNGYRLYIDELMAAEPLPAEEQQRLDDMLAEQGAVTEELLIQSATTALAELTQCAAVVSSAMPKFSIISKVEVIPTGKRLYVILLITSSGSIKNKVCRLEFDLSHEQLDFFTHFMEENLQGVSVEALSEDTIAQLITALGAYMTTLSPLVEGICELSRDLAHKELTVSGTRNLLSCAELDKMDIVRFMEETDTVIPLLDDAFGDIQVMFSEEKSNFVIGNSSLIVSKYKKGGKMAGSLGVIGPMRLDYKKIIPYIQYFSQKLTDLVSDEEEA
ncbi:MAG: heat-inducible transcription repressor HrcA [Ruminococcus sp.]|nr:heat-inducible transcription repressor HrcA [Ruminococcus sp.]MBQ8905735.1 heat-inducible transcription repressor HrcA [Ruminococcus sp.]